MATAWARAWAGARISMSVRRVYEGYIINVDIDDVMLPNGVNVSLDIVRHPGAAAVVALHDNRDVSLVRQFRHAADGYLWEIPAGTRNGAEDPALCAARELREEAGLLAAE